MPSGKSKNVTFTLPVELVDKLKSYVQSESISSLNAGVREALEQYTAKLEKEALLKKMTEAAADPLFMYDLRESMKAFEAADEEPSNGGEEW